jgi:hypothetical protein
MQFGSTNFDGKTQANGSRYVPRLLKGVVTVDSFFAPGPSPGRGSGIEIVKLVKSGGLLTKHFHVKSDGTIGSDASRCRMSAGVACRLKLEDVRELARVITVMPANAALALGALAGRRFGGFGPVAHLCKGRSFRPKRGCLSD